MLECLTLTLCVVGGMQISPDYYQLEVLDTVQERIWTYYMPMPRMVVPHSAISLIT